MEMLYAVYRRHNNLLQTIDEHLEHIKEVFKRLKEDST
jgi:hypothetical protein